MKIVKIVTSGNPVLVTPLVRKGNKNLTKGKYPAYAHQSQPHTDEITHFIRSTNI